MNATAPLRALFRVDSGRRIGAGHVMRCLALAGELRAAGVECLFLCRAHEGHLGAAIAAAGHRVALAPVAPELAARDDYAGWLGGDLADEIARAGAILAEMGGRPLLVVDHYGLDAAYERALRPRVGGVVVFDDLYDRPRACDILIDQNVGHTPDLFAGLAPGALLLVGAAHAPLRPDFAAAREAALARRRAGGPARALLVSVGGFDHLDVTSRVLEALDPAAGFGLGWIEETHVVLASGAPYLAQARALAERLAGVRLHVDARDMPALLSAADLAIGGSGVSAIERCVLGLPTLIVVMADNQEGSARRLEALGATLTLGHGARLTPAAIAAGLARLGGDARLRHDMMEKAAALCDGHGLARIAGPVIALARGATAALPET